MQTHVIVVMMEASVLVCMSDLDHDPDLFPLPVQFESAYIITVTWQLGVISQI